MANDKPGKDLATCIWIKSLRSTRQYLKGCLKNVITRKTEIPDWLITTKTILISKNKETKNEQNYCQIAIQNSMYNIYTSILAEFITDHCTENYLITEEQAAGKRGSWGCTDQLLVNKMIHKEVTGNIRNLITVWLDYKKAFDSVPHDSVIKSLQIAKVPTIIIQVIQSLMNKWKTRIHLYGESNTIETKLIDYYREEFYRETF